MMLAAPVFFPAGTPNTMKVGVSAVIAMILSPVISVENLPEITSFIGLIPLISKEIILGLCLGYIVSLIFGVVQMAGQMLDFSMGFSMMTMFDPMAGETLSIMGRLFYWICAIVFLLVDGHLLLIKAIIESFKVVPIGTFILSQNHISYIIHIIFKFFTIGLKIAIPIMLVILIIEIVIGLVARVMPQLNAMILSMPIKIFVGLLTFIITIPIIIEAIVANFDNLADIFDGFLNMAPMIIIFASSDSGDKTEEATPKKKQDAKKKGQVAKSKELNSALTLGVSALALIGLSEYITDNLREVMATYLSSYPNFVINGESFIGIIINVLIKIAMIFLPIALPIMLMGIIGNFAQTGRVNTMEPLKPKLSKLNPINGFKRMFSIRAVVDLIKNLLIVSVVGYIGYVFIRDNYFSILELGNYRTEMILVQLSSFINKILKKVALVLLIVGIGDFAYQKYQHKKDLKMTKQEIKEEFKQQEGDPQIKGKIRQKQREMSMKRMMQAVPDATVVITNPTHLAIAIKYEKDSGKAPMVVAKGSDHMALKIKEIAIDNKVPVIENKPLARLMYSQVELDEEIPYDMYQAVAEILVLVLKLKK